MTQSPIDFKRDPTHQPKHRLDTIVFPVKFSATLTLVRKNTGGTFWKFGKVAEHCNKIKAIFTVTES